MCEFNRLPAQTTVSLFSKEGRGGGEGGGHLFISCLSHLSIDHAPLWGGGGSRTDPLSTKAGTKWQIVWHGSSSTWYLEPLLFLPRILASFCCFRFCVSPEGARDSGGAVPILDARHRGRLDARPVSQSVSTKVMADCVVRSPARLRMFIYAIRSRDGNLCHEYCAYTW